MQLEKNACKNILNMQPKTQKLTGRVSLLTCPCGNRVHHWGNRSDSDMGGCRKGSEMEWHWQRLEYVSAAIDRHCSLRSNDKFQYHSVVHSQCAVESHVYAHHPPQHMPVVPHSTHQVTLTHEFLPNKTVRCVQCHVLKNSCVHSFLT